MKNKRMKQIILCILAALVMMIIYLIAINATVNPYISLAIVGAGGFCGAWLLSNYGCKSADQATGYGVATTKTSL